MEPTNAISRLYNYIYNLKCSSEANPFTAFSKIFSLKDDEHIKIFLAYSDLFNLCNSSIDLIEKNFPSATVLKEHISNTVYALSKIDFNDADFGMRSFKTALKDTTLTGLQTLAIMIPICEETLSKESLKDISQEIHILLNEIHTIELNPTLKDVLISRLHDILIIIDKYAIYGSTVLLKSLETCIGAIYINHPNIKNVSEKNLCKNILLKLTKSISFISNTVPLLEYVEKFLS